MVTVPRPDNKDKFSAYIRAELFHSGEKQDWKSEVVKVTDVAEDTGADILWTKDDDREGGVQVQRFEWEYDAGDLTFIRYVKIITCTHHNQQTTDPGFYITVSTV